jgi:hypothetical protein
MPSPAQGPQAREQAGRPSARRWLASAWRNASAAATPHRRRSLPPGRARRRRPSRKRQVHSVRRPTAELVDVQVGEGLELADRRRALAARPAAELADVGQGPRARRSPPRGPPPTPAELADVHPGRPGPRVRRSPPCARRRPPGRPGLEFADRRRALAAGPAELADVHQVHDRQRCLARVERARIHDRS